MLCKVPGVKPVILTPERTARGGLMAVVGPTRHSRVSMSLVQGTGHQGAILAAAQPYYHPQHTHAAQDVQPDRPIGYGAFGVVWAVTDPRDGRRVALKKLPNVFQSLVSSKRVLRELKMLCFFKHENVLSALDILQPPHLDFFQEMYPFNPPKVTSRGVICTGRCEGIRFRWSVSSNPKCAIKGRLGKAYRTILRLKNDVLACLSDVKVRAEGRDMCVSFKLHPAKDKIPVGRSETTSCKPRRPPLAIVGTTTKPKGPPLLRVGATTNKPRVPFLGSVVVATPPTKPKGPLLQRVGTTTIKPKKLSLGKLRTTTSKSENYPGKVRTATSKPLRLYLAKGGASTTKSPRLLPGKLPFGRERMTTFRPRGPPRKSFKTRQSKKIILKCLKNCKTSDYTQDIVFQVVSSEVGGGVPSSGRVYFSDRETPCIEDSPPCVTVQKESDGTLVQVNGGTLDSGEYVKLVFENEIAQASIWISTAGNELKIICLSNCDEFNANLETGFRVSCQVGAKCDGFVTSWLVTPSVKPVKMEGPENNVLKIPPKTMQGGMNVTLTVTKGPLNRKTYYFKTTGQCDLTPKTGFSHTTLFMLHCNYVSKTQVQVYQKTEGSEEALIFTGPVLNGGFFLEEGTPSVVTAIIGSKKFQFPNIAVEKPPENEDVASIVFGNHTASLPRLLEQRRYDEVVQRATLLLSELKNITDDTLRNHVLRHIASDVEEAAPNVDVDEVLQFLLQAVQVNASGDAETLRLFAGTLLDVVETLVKDSQHNQDPEVRMTVDKILNVASAITNASTRVEVVNVTGLLSDVDYPSYGDRTFSYAAFAQFMRDISFSLTQIVKALGKLTDASGFDGLGVMTSENIFTSTTKLPWRTPMEITTPGNISSVKISQELANQLTYSADVLYIQVAAFKINPFWWDTTAKDINTQVLMINVFSGHNYRTKLNGDIDIFLQQSPSEPGKIQGELPLDQDSWRVHRIDMKGSTKVNISFIVLDEEYYGFVTVLYPSLEDIRQNGKKIMKGGTSGQNQWIIDVKDTMAYVGVARKLGKTLNYEIEVSGVSCMSWDGLKWDWESSDCSVGPNTTKNITHCRCSHLSLFGGSFLVPPNKITFFSELPLLVAFSRSILVFVVVFAILVIWTALMVWAAHRDKILSRRGVHLLRDRVPGDMYHYLVGVVTGVWRRSGTTAHVAIQLLGEEAHSRVHLLEAAGALQQGGEDWFVMPTPRHLGNVLAVRVFHDSYGRRPDWFCERVVVQDLTLRKQYTFLGQKWLSLIRADGAVDRLFQQSATTNLRKGRVLFPQHASAELRDSHMWLSVFARPPDSTFTSKERVTLAVAVLMLSLTASAMFYGTEEGLEPEGHFFMTLRELAIIIESLIVTVPLGVIITVLFRKSKPLPSSLS